MLRESLNNYKIFSPIIFMSEKFNKFPAEGEKRFESTNSLDGYHSCTSFIIPFII